MLSTSSARCFNGVVITVKIGKNKVILKVLFTFKCNKNGVDAKNTIGLVVGRWNVYVVFYRFSDELSNTTVLLYTTV